MPRRDAERTVQASVLDRLIDRDPKRGADPALSTSQSIQEMKEALRRDLEWLLNTRRVVEPAPEALEELQASLYHYGLPDITSLSADAPQTRTVLMRYVHDAIALFEPRLTGVRVSPVESEDEPRRILRFLIEGTLEMEPSPEQVAFDTVLEVASGTFQVR